MGIKETCPNSSRSIPDLTAIYLYNDLLILQTITIDRVDTPQ